MSVDFCAGDIVRWLYRDEKGGFIRRYGIVEGKGKLDGYARVRWPLYDNVVCDVSLWWLEREPDEVVGLLGVLDDDGQADTGQSEY